MDQELKQRLIGAVVITALAAIFVPMLFDDPIDESGQVVNELELPDAPVKSFDETASRLPPDSVMERGETELSDEEADDIETGDGVELEPKLLADDAVEDDAVEDIGFEPEPFVAEPIYEAEIDPEPIASETDNPPNAPISEPPVKQLDSTKTRDNRSVSAVPDDAGLIKSGWYVQLGSFGQKENAYSLRDKLRTQGFLASVDEVATDKGKSYRLVVGPEPDKEKALAEQAKLDKLNRTKSLLVAVGQGSAMKSAATGADAAAPVDKAGASGSVLVRWYIQLGSFSKRENAYSLRDKLRSQGYPVTIDVVGTSSGKSYRLRVGPELDKKRAEAMQAQLEKRNHLNSLLVSE
ncbi:MAG: SPOR domain-containing protein [Gammaproteobacteria bacterium]